MVKIKAAVEGYISEGQRVKSVEIYDDGIERAKELCAEYEIHLSEESGGLICLK